MEYLYHYTSLETLALILSNKTICFNNLLNVDDIEEAETEDMGNFGKFVYVSCWTEDQEESIPLWNLYTPNMHGVRIKLPLFPFKKYRFSKGTYYLSEDVETYINMEKLYNEDEVCIVSSQPKLIEVEYTNEKNKLFPKIRLESCEGALQKFLSAKNLSDIGDTFNINYDLSNIGKFKRENWKFQKEWRYTISISPIGMKESNPPSFEKQQNLLKKLEDRNLKVPYQRLFLDLDEDALDKMEIVFGPRMTEAEKVMAKSLIKEYCPNCQYKDSVLKIK